MLARDNRHWDAVDFIDDPFRISPGEVYSGNGREDFDSKRGVAHAHNLIRPEKKIGGHLSFTETKFRESRDDIPCVRLVYRNPDIHTARRTGIPVVTYRIAPDQQILNVMVA